MRQNVHSYVSVVLLQDCYIAVLLQDVLLPEPENYQNRNPCSSKIWRLLPVCVKNTNPMRFPREVQNLVKIGNKLWK